MVQALNIVTKQGSSVAGNVLCALWCPHTLQKLQKIPKLFQTGLQIAKTEPSYNVPLLYL